MTEEDNLMEHIAHLLIILNIAELLIIG